MTLFEYNYFVYDYKNNKDSQKDISEFIYKVVPPESTIGESIIGESTTGESTIGESTTGESTTGESTTGESTTEEENKYTISEIFTKNNISIYNSVGQCIHGYTNIETPEQQQNVDIMKMLIFGNIKKSLYEKFIIIKEIYSIKEYKFKLDFLELILNKKYYFNITIDNISEDKTIFNKLFLNPYLDNDIYDRVKEEHDKTNIVIYQSGGTLLKDDIYYYKYMKYKTKYLKLIKYKN